MGFERLIHLKQRIAYVFQSNWQCRALESALEFAEEHAEGSIVLRGVTRHWDDRSAQQHLGTHWH